MTHSPSQPKAPDKTKEHKTEEQDASNSLTKRMRKGGSISIAGFGFSQAIRLLSNLIMARLLLPDAFGLLAIAVSLQVLMIMISDLGINQSVIRSKNTHQSSFLSTAWTVQILRGVILAIGLVLSCVVIVIMARSGVFQEDSIFNDKRLPIFILTSASITLLDGFRSIKFVLNQRDMALDRVVGLEISSQLFGMAMMFIAFYAGAGPYALLVNMVSSVSLSVIGSHLFLPGPKVSFGFINAHFKEIFHYGKWIMLASLCGFLIQRGDQFIFGTILEAEQFGLYAIATIWINVAIMLIDNLGSRIAYPALAEVWRERPSQLGPLYTKLRLVADGLCLAIFLGIIFLSEFFFSFLYPQAYNGLITYLHWLAIIVLFLPYRMLNTVILAEGKSRNFLTLTIGPTFMILVATPIVYLLTNVKTAIIFTTFSQVTSIPLAWFYANKFMKLSAIRELPMAIFAILSALYLLS